LVHKYGYGPDEVLQARTKAEQRYRSIKPTVPTLTKQQEFEQDLVVYPGTDIKGIYNDKKFSPVNNEKDTVERKATETKLRAAEGVLKIDPRLVSRQDNANRVAARAAEILQEKKDLTAADAYMMAHDELSGPQENTAPRRSPEYKPGVPLSQQTELLDDMQDWRPGDERREKEKNQKIAEFTSSKNFVPAQPHERKAGTIGTWSVRGGADQPVRSFPVFKSDDDAVMALGPGKPYLVFGDKALRMFQGDREEAIRKHVYPRFKDNNLYSLEDADRIARERGW
jgi:hypothetical protein